MSVSLFALNIIKIDFISLLYLDKSFFINSTKKFLGINSKDSIPPMIKQE